MNETHEQTHVPKPQSTYRVVSPKNLFRATAPSLHHCNSLLRRMESHRMNGEGRSQGASARLLPPGGLPRVRSPPLYRKGTTCVTQTARPPGVRPVTALSSAHCHGFPREAPCQPLTSLPGPHPFPLSNPFSARAVPLPPWSLRPRPGHFSGFSLVCVKALCTWNVHTSNIWLPLSFAAACRRVDACPQHGAREIPTSLLTLAPFSQPLKVVQVAACRNISFLPFCKTVFHGMNE